MREIKNRNWLIHRFPYRHAIVPDLLEEAVLAQLTANFKSRVLAHNAATSRIANYDATVVPLSSGDTGAFAPFLNFEWLKLISRAMGLDAKFEVDGALHSHPPGSRSGWIHNDYNPGWFGRLAEQNEVYLNDGECNYRTGKMRADAEGVCRMRYITLIFYLGNPQWRAGMGGETGIYLSQNRPVDSADIFVPPKDNTLLLFECTPHSWHTFRTTSFQRNSITLWLHRDSEDARKQWPNHEPVYWT